MLVILSLTAACQLKTGEPMAFEDYPVYEGDDLGLTYTPERSTFKIWSPPAKQVMLRLYAQGEGEEEAFEEYEMKRSLQGVWMYIVEKDIKWAYYTFQVKIGDIWLDEAFLIPTQKRWVLMENAPR